MASVSGSGNVWVSREEPRVTKLLTSIGRQPRSKPGFVRQPQTRVVEWHRLDLVLVSVVADSHLVLAEDPNVESVGRVAVRAKAGPGRPSAGPGHGHGFRAVWQPSLMGPLLPGSARRAPRARRGQRRGRSLSAGSESGACRTAHESMDGLHRFSGTIGLRLTPVHDQVKGAQRSQQPPPQVASIVQVIDEAGSTSGWATCSSTAGPPPSKGTSGEVPTRRMTLSGAK